MPNTRIEKMVQLYNTLFNAFSKNISSGKKGRLCIGREPDDEFTEEAKKNDILLTATSVFNATNCKNFAKGHSKRGKKGLNQDCFIVQEKFGCQEDMILCGVFDGHGPWGHLVSKRVKEQMPRSLLCNWQESVALNSVKLDKILEFDQNSIEFDIWKHSYFKTCAEVDQQLQQHSGIDSFYSGSTALTVVRQGDVMIVANVGDSRAVLATMSDDGSLIATQLTNDLKPNLPYESKRIAQSRGRVFACPDEPGVYRVWMSGQMPKGPGLAVSRAFGDYCLKDFGLISEPEVTIRNLSTRDEFVILATDGVWDVMSNQEAVEIVASTPERAQSAKRLVERAVCAWKCKGRAATMDDISAVCLFLRHNNALQSAYNMKLNEE